MRLTGLALCVMNGAVRDADRFVFNTCGCTTRSASRDRLEASVGLSVSIPHNLRVSPSLADYGMDPSGHQGPGSLAAAGGLRCYEKTGTQSW